MARARSRNAPNPALLATIGAEIVQFQEASGAFDTAAAEVLALDRTDLAVVTLLTFGGPAAPDALCAAMGRSRRALAGTLERIQMAGYARRAPGPNGEERIELTEHARQWIETIWGPVQEDGGHLLAGYSSRELALIARVVKGARAIEEKHVARLRAQLDSPAPRAKANRLRGGLSPAALRRVQLFVEANLEHAVPLSDLAARAGLSVFHFARAFKATMGTTPRLFVEQRRVERARMLLRGTDRTIAQIAVETGFGTQSRLTTAFRRATGITPARIRRGERG